MNQFEWKVSLEDAPSNLVDALLESRGVRTEDREVFLNPDFAEHTHSPWLFTRMKDAVAEVFARLESGEQITIHGDYDADGVSGASLLYLAITEITRSLGLPGAIGVYLPDRERDGYGVALHTVERLASEGTKLLITVDCGIANLVELRRAHELGVTVIVCDHHQLAQSIPEHAMVIHPLAPGETYPNKHLCGTGVAFKLASALFDEARKRGAAFPDGHEKWYLDFVAIATVTDVMPILGENRVLEHFGLKVLNKTRRHGIREIVNYSRSELGALDTQAIGFQIGPRINAAGRIKSAQIAFNALTAGTASEARTHAEELERLNRERKKISDGAYKEALAQVHDLLRESQPMALVVHSEYWNPGIVGLVAGKLVTEFGLPSFALTRVGEHYVGSGRTAGGLHLVEAMNSVGDIYIKRGGHPQACGLTLEPRYIDQFTQGIQSYAQSIFGAQPPSPQLAIDAHVPLGHITYELLDQLSKLQPFGEGNREPIFIARAAQLESFDTIGKEDKHLRLLVKTGTGRIKGIGFNFGHLAEELEIGGLFDLVYRPSVNEWNGRKELQFELIDMKKTL